MGRGRARRVFAIGSEPRAGAGQPPFPGFGFEELADWEAGTPMPYADRGTTTGLGPMAGCKYLFKDKINSQ